MCNFQKSLKKVLLLEGGYVDHPNDPGGKTNFGITELTARQYGYTGDMKIIDQQTVSNIYKKFYWDSLSLDKLNGISYELAFEMFEAAVNCGTIRIGQWFCNIIDILTGKQLTYYEAIDYASKRPQDCLLLAKMMNIRQGKHYMDLVAKNAKFRVFIKGWMKRVEINEEK